jgi:transcriptional regulator with XRE-family HTH domain
MEGAPWAGGKGQADAESLVGRLLREWRGRRRMSQLDLATEAGISSRHVSFVETGRSRPSRDMVLLLARVLDVPLRDRNDLLAAAGYAPIYRETRLDAPEMTQVLRALDFILRQHEPYPAIVLDRQWNVLRANEGTARLVEAFVDPTAELGAPNAMRLMFHPKGFRPHIVNWEATAAALIQWLHRDVLTGAGGAEARRLLDELLSYPAVPGRWRTLDLDASTGPFLAIDFRRGDLELRYFSTLTGLGTPHDITLQEIRIESFFPADQPPKKRPGAWPRACERGAPEPWREAVGASTRRTARRDWPVPRGTQTGAVRPSSASVAADPCDLVRPSDEGSDRGEPTVMGDKPHRGISV